MLEPPIPPDEAERLAALKALGLLDTPKDARFERIARTAALLLRVPIATITLVDAERQWFKSRFGLFTAETPRRVSFCGHAILQDEVMVVEDASQDERFADKPLVTGSPHIRFYAGRPLHAPGGERIGTLCLIDREPRRLGDTELVTLDDLAHWAEMEIGLFVRERDAELHLTKVLDLLVWPALRADAEGRVLWVNRALLEFTGWERSRLEGGRLADLVREGAPVLVAPDGSTKTGLLPAEGVLLDRSGRPNNLGITVVESQSGAGRRFTLLFSRPRT